MRTLMKIRIGGDSNASPKLEAIPEVLESTMKRLKPEAAYFFPENGVRTAYIVFDMKEPSELPPIVEPFFSLLNAKVEVFPVMNADDVRAGMKEAMKAAR